MNKSTIILFLLTIFLIVGNTYTPLKEALTTNLVYILAGLVFVEFILMLTKPLSLSKNSPATILLLFICGFLFVCIQYEPLNTVVASGTESIMGAYYYQLTTNWIVGLATGISAAALVAVAAVKGWFGIRKKSLQSVGSDVKSIGLNTGIPGTSIIDRISGFGTQQPAQTGQIGFPSAEQKKEE